MPASRSIGRRVIWFFSSVTQLAMPAVKDPRRPTRSVSASVFVTRSVPCFFACTARWRSIRCGKSTFQACGGTYGHLVMKHMSQSVQACSTVAYFSFGTPSSSPVGPLSIRSNSRGKESHRLKQRRQPWQMSKMRAISCSRAASSQNQGLRQSMGSRVGASRLPSRMVFESVFQAVFQE
jgi:hypothetical protein